MESEGPDLVHVFHRYLVSLTIRSHPFYIRDAQLTLACLPPPSSLTIASSIRLRTISKLNFQTTTNPTRDFEGVAIWSSIEITVGVVVACLPAARKVVISWLANVQVQLPTLASKWTSKDPSSSSGGGGGGGSWSKSSAWSPWKSGGGFHWSSKSSSVPKAKKFSPTGTELIGTRTGNFAELLEEEAGRQHASPGEYRTAYSGRVGQRMSAHERVEETEMRAVGGLEKRKSSPLYFAHV